MSWSHCFAAGLWLVTLGAPAWAQYKVVLPDGSVTYTDRPPTSTAARITPMRGGKVPAEAQPSGLPLELRLAAQRYPVTLYSAPACTTCDNARRMLQLRGIPYAERRVLNDDDITALERLVGGRTVPSLSIGAQALRGFADADWHEFLDAAGYPRDSKLPRGWKQAEVTPLAERVAPAAAPAPASATAPPRTGVAPTQQTAAPSSPPTGTIRF